MSEINEAIENAAKHLPEGYVVEIHIEKDGYGVYLRGPELEIHSVDGGGLVEDINEAIAKAQGF